MRFDQTCPKCSRQKFAVTESFTATGGAFVPVIADLKRHGLFETWICLHCGFTEFYAHDLPHDIEEIIKQDSKHWRIVDATPPEKGPYR
jgi:predicted nucleic-acid-binding Zn-ribbon protein